MQNKFIFLSVIVLIGISVIGINQSFAQTDVQIPPWVKGVASFWVEGNIDDGEFAEALEFLIDSDIIQLGNTVIVSENKVDENPFGIEEDNRTLEKKHAESISILDKQMKDQKEMYEKKINELMDSHDIDYAEWKESYHISEEEKSKLQQEVIDLKHKNFQLKTTAEK